MSHKRRLTLLLGGFCLVGALGRWPLEAADQTASNPAKAAPRPDEIARWIAALDDDRFLAREQATQNLLSAGSAALDPLLTVANGDRPESADRAIWLMRRLGRSRDDELALVALEHLVQLKGRPALVSKAESELDERIVAVCDHRLTPLGAEIVLQPMRIDPNTVAPVLSVRLGSNWHGTTEDLRGIAKLQRQACFQLEGAAVDDAVAKMFETRQKLAFVMFRNTKVSAAGVDALKLRHPETVVFVRNRAMLGVGGENHASGVRVTEVRPGTAAAAAGIVLGDIIATIDGHPLPDFDRLTARVAQHQPGDKIDVEILRGDQKTKVSVTLGSWEGQE